MSTEALNDRWIVADLRGHVILDSPPQHYVWSRGGVMIVDADSPPLAERLVADHNDLLDAVDRLPPPAFFYAGETRAEIGSEEAWGRDQVVAFGAALLRQAVTGQGSSTLQRDESRQPPLPRDAGAAFVYKVKVKGGMTSESKGALSIAQHAAVSRVLGTHDLPVIWPSGRITAVGPA